MKNTAPQHTVLLVDDERNLVRVLETRLRREGYSTLAASDGAEALAVLRRYPVSVVVLDVQMAGMTGQESLKAVHALRPDVPVVLMSAYGKPEGLPASVSYLEKPFNLDMLVSAVANAVQVHRPPVVEGGLFALFAPGQRVRLVIPDGEGLCYSTGWVQGESEDTLEIDAPAPGGRTLSPPANAAVRLTATGRDALYSFNTRVQSIEGDRLVLAKPAIIERHQRRRATRVDRALPVRLEVLRPDAQNKSVRLPAAWNSVNLSDTGMMVTGEASVPVNSAVLFSLTLPEGDRRVRGQARVVWDAAAPNSGIAMGLEFIGLEDADRRALRAYIASAPPPTASVS